ncbi:MAG: glucuronate isomerase [Clostridia bacterium]|nr:glucuronate isomerase [Clostridia bacterium]
MSNYIKDNFLLTNKTAERLYNLYAKKMPIFDYHCHLPEKQILENKTFNDVYEIWLAGDHYKWRLMRNYGVNEEYITGNKTNKEKFIAYCTVLGTAFGNPLYHWSQVELKEFFNCELEINADNAELIWDWCNEYIALNKITPQKLIEQSNVTNIFTTNEVFDDLTTFTEIAKKDYRFKVIPAFRGDKIMNVDAVGYCDQLAKLEALTHPIHNIDDLMSALEERLKAFIAVGTTASDISVESVYPVSTAEEANEVLCKVKAGGVPTVKEAEIFKGYLTYALMRMYAQYNISTELHVGAMRNNNTQMLKKLGLDTGYDSISDENSIKTMSRLFDKLNDENLLPKTIVFNLNPKMNAEIMSLIGAFQSDEARGKMQYGPAWWFLDNKVGMEKHLRDLTATGHIAVFVGMLTDSRSLLSYPRHHYFRRILCNYFGDMMEKGEMTQNEALVGKVVEDICYNNSMEYFRMK